jgi:hypothetical protein
MVPGFKFPTTIGFKHCSEFWGHKQHQADGTRRVVWVGSDLKLAGWKRARVPQVSLVNNYEYYIILLCLVAGEASLISDLQLQGKGASCRATELLWVRVKIDFLQPHHHHSAAHPHPRTSPHSRLQPSDLTDTKTFNF